MVCEVSECVTERDRDAASHKIENLPMVALVVGASADADIEHKTTTTSRARIGRFFSMFARDDCAPKTQELCLLFLTICRSCYTS